MHDYGAAYARLCMAVMQDYGDYGEMYDHGDYGRLWTIMDDYGRL